MLARRSSKHVLSNTPPAPHRGRAAREAASQYHAIFEPLEGRAFLSAAPLLPAPPLPTATTQASTVHVSFNPANGLLLPAVDGLLLPAVDQGLLLPAVDQGLLLPAVDQGLLLPAVDHGLLLPAVDGLLLPAVDVTTNINHTGVVITVTSVDTVQTAFVVAAPGGFQFAPA